jgi:hypothetical protein
LENGTFLNASGSSYYTNLWSYGANPPAAAPVAIGFDNLDFKLVVAEAGTGALEELSPFGGAPTPLASGLATPAGLALDAAANAYVADAAAHALYQLAYGATNFTPLLTNGLGGPAGVAVDGAGNVYVADQLNQVVLKWTWIGKQVSLLPMGTLSQPSGVAVDGSGNVFVDCQGGNNLVELPHAYVDPTPRQETGQAGNDTLPAVLPAGAPLTGAFAPTSDSAWLTVTGVTNGVVSFAFTATGAGRTGHLTLLGQNVAITQTGSLPAPVLTHVTTLTGGHFSFSFTSNPTASFTVLTTTNLALPVSQWSVAGPATNLGGGAFGYTASLPANGSQQFFRVRSP